MKTKLIVLCGAIAGATPSFAQSTLTVYGVLDAAISRYQTDGGASKTLMTSSANQSSRLGFRGREDLGGGIWTGFDLEAGLNNDSGLGQSTNTNNQASGNVPAGGLTFNRKSTVGIGGSWGEFRLGRDYTPSFWNLFVYDPFRVGVGLGGITSQGSTVTVFRASNSVGYFSPGCSTPQCKGFYGQAMYALGENASGTATSSDGKYLGARLGYGGTNWGANAATGTTNSAAAGNYLQSNLGASYDFGVINLMFMWGTQKTGLPTAALGGGTKATHTQLGGWIPFGSDYIPVALTRMSRNDAANGKADKLAIGYVKNLSKRTAVYVTYAKINNKNGMAIAVNAGADAGPTPTVGRSASGFDFGIRHSF
jgi:predicted porin